MGSLITSTCGGCQAQLITDSFNCPDCNNVIIDMASDSRSDEQIAQAVMNPYPCLTCNKQVLLKEVVSCDSCGTPKQNTIMDVVIHGMRQGDGKNSKMVMSRFEGLAAFEQKAKKDLQGKPLAEVIDALGKAYEFDQVFAPRDAASQAKRLMVQVTHTPTSQSPFGQPQVFGNSPVMPPAPAMGGGFFVNGTIPTFGPPSDSAHSGPTPFVPPPLPNFGK